MTVKHICRYAICRSWRRHSRALQFVLDALPGRSCDGSIPPGVPPVALCLISRTIAMTRTCPPPPGLTVAPAVAPASRRYRKPSPQHAINDRSHLGPPPAPAPPPSHSRKPPCLKLAPPAPPPSLCAAQPRGVRPGARRTETSPTLAPLTAYRTLARLPRSPRLTTNTAPPIVVAWRDVAPFHLGSCCARCTARIFGVLAGFCGLRYET